MSGSTAVMEAIPSEKLTKYVRFLVGSFRVGEAEDGEVLTRGLTAMLGGYPEWVVRAVCDPRSGLPATCKFFPTLYEVRSACEARIGPALAEDARRRRLLAEEADRPTPVSDAESERRRAVVAAWRAQQAVAEATKAGADTPLEALDARKLQGEHREIVKSALNAKIAKLSEASASTPMQLSDAAFATPALRFLASSQEAERM